MNSKLLDKIALILVIIGGLNWGLVAFKYNLVDMVFGAWPMILQLVYVLVGLSALWMLVKLTKKS